MADCFGLRFPRCRRFPAGLCEDWRYRADAHAFRLSADGYRCRWARVRLRAVACASGELIWPA